MESLKPLGDRVIIEPVERERVTAGGIILPETAREKSCVGIVLAVGPGVWGDAGRRIPMTVREEDRVLFAKYAGSEVVLEDGCKVLILREAEVLAIIGDAEAE